MRLLHSFLFLLGFFSSVSAQNSCKSTPQDFNWPASSEWKALNQSINGGLIRTSPAASSCYAGNPFNAHTNCSDVTQHWSYAAHHAEWPESVDYSVWTNNSCLPPGVSGYMKGRGCSIGALPQYIVNATTEPQVATAMKWATDRNIRIVIKGTGHDLSGRSTGAFSLSIWTHNFDHFEYRPAWKLPDGSGTDSVAICGSGNNWGTVYNHMHQFNRTVVGGEDATVGLGGLIQNGGHGLLSSHYGLASDQVYQVTVITVDGKRLVANSVQNSDIFWAICGAGGGQFGVVTEFVLKTYPAPRNVVTGGLSFYPGGDSNTTDGSWKAFAEAVSLIPDVMDSGYLGTVIAGTGSSASIVTGGTLEAGVAVSINLVAYNTTTGVMNATVSRLKSVIANTSQSEGLQFITTDPSTSGYWSYIKPNFLASSSCGVSSLTTSRLLGRKELSDLPKTDLMDYLQQTSVSESTGSMLLFGLQAGRGPASTPENMRGSVLPAWRSAYVHLMSYGASFNITEDPGRALAEQVNWVENNKEPVWRNWAPESGSYMNEGNVFSSTWKQDFYGANYERLLDIKHKFDPTGSLFVWGGVGSDMWNYDLNSGLLCHV
ncbi:hypothetical protein PMG11_01176 [Penicillium brasilianum]|uniref:FAD-binding PCMH-type domain-containing protein n=1 Tax=Penicillium brasilianum TaxID=104259 RepID=A0A0F7TIN8_PENBI|nr:hypothetical protein PMG11_01176 [Penicillium brasilianum]